MAKIVGFGYRFCKKQDVIFALWDDGKRTIFERVSNPHIHVDFQAEQYAKARDVAFAGEIPLTKRQPNKGLQSDGATRPASMWVEEDGLLSELRSYRE